MKRIQLRIDYTKLNLNPMQLEEAKKTGCKTIFENLLTAGLTSRYPQGLTGLVRRTFARILERLDEACGSEDTNWLLDLESAEYDLVKDVFCNEQTTYHPSQTRPVSQFVQQIEEAARDSAY